MGNISGCADVCKSTKNDRWEIPALEREIQQQDQNDTPSKYIDSIFTIHNPNQSIRKTRLGELLDQQMPSIQVQIQQNHMIVPISLVKQRVTNKLSIAMGEELTLSSFKDESKWYLLPSGNYYSGEFRNNQPYGIGTFLLQKMIYFGAVKNNKPQGEGSILGQQFQFKGRFVRGRASGQGQLIFNSCYLKGEFKNGKIQKGKLSCLQYEYQGQFVNCQPYGFGQYHSNDHKECFIGQFQQGKPKGTQFSKCLKGKNKQQQDSQLNFKKKKNALKDKSKNGKKTWLLC